MVWLALLLSFSAPALAQGQEPEIREGYNTPIPGSIMTPDTVETKHLGTLKFTDGRPTKKTADKLYDHLAYLRAIEVFLNWMPACSIEAMRMGHVNSGITKPNQVAISEQLMDSTRDGIHQPL